METRDSCCSALFADLNNHPASRVGPPTKDSRQFAKGAGRNAAGHSVLVPIWNGQLASQSG
jgi:hypothetical protein